MKRPTHTLAALLSALCLNSALAVDRSWTGGGADDNWNNPSNWNPSGAPADGDNLSFPAATTPTVTNNNLVGRTFGHVTFSIGTTVTGNAFSLSGGITASSFTPGRWSILIEPNLTLTASQTFSATILNSLALDGLVVFSGHTLTVDGAGTVAFNSVAGGAAAATKLIKNGAGLLRFASPGGALTTPQPLDLTNGTLDADGTVQAVVNMTGASSRLTGEGSVNGVTATAGAIEADAGDLSINGALSLSGTASCVFELTGPSAVNQLACSGTVSISGGATMVPSYSGSPPSHGAVFTLINKTSVGPITGQFTGFPDGAALTLGTSVGVLDYQGGGNDLTVTVISVTKTWDGDATLNDNWQDGDNWNADIAPLAGDILVFPTGIGALDRGTDNNFPNDTVFRQLIFNGDDFTVRGNPFRLSHGLIVPTNVTTHLDTDVALSRSQTFLVDGKLELDTLDKIDTAGHQLHLAGSGLVLGKITGTGAVYVAGETESDQAFITMRQAHDYTGQTLIETGSRLTLEKLSGLNPDPTLGTTAGNTEVRGTLLLDSNQVLGAFDLPENLVLNGGTVLLRAFDSELGATDGVNRLTGTITVQPNFPSTIATRSFLFCCSGAQEISGRIQGTGVLTFDLEGKDNNKTTINGSLANTHTGIMQVTGGGKLILEKSSAGILAVASPDLRILGNDGPTELETQQSEQIADSCKVTINSGGKFNIGNLTARTETIGELLYSTFDGLAGNASVGGASNSLLILNGQLRQIGVYPATHAVATRITQANTVLNIDDSVSFQGALTRTGSGSIRKIGPGRANIADAASAPFEVQAGDLVFVANEDGDGAGSPVTLNGGKVGGDGRCGSITSLAAGGTIDSHFQFKNFTTGSLSLNSATTLRRLVKNANPGVGYDQLVVFGTVNLGGASLQMSVDSPFNVSVGQSLTILVNDGADPITGAFAGLPPNAHLSLGGGIFQISYTGGNGNDVALTRVNFVETDVTSLTLTPAGGGSAPGTLNADVTGKGMFGLKYRLEASSDLASWSPAPSVPVTTANSLGEVDFPLLEIPPGTLREFYRVVWIP